MDWAWIDSIDRGLTEVALLGPYTLRVRHGILCCILPYFYPDPS